MSVIYRWLCIGAEVYLWFHYEENPTVITVAGILVLLIFLILGNDEITVYDDKIVESDTSIASLVFRLKRRVHHIADIKRAALPEQVKSDAAEIGAGLIVSLILPLRSRRRYTNRNIINLDLKDGSTSRITTDLELSKVGEIIAAINSVVSK